MVLAEVQAVVEDGLAVREVLVLQTKVMLVVLVAVKQQVSLQAVVVVRLRWVEMV
jgi:hypothetical protein